jgi:hypothetical protein
MSTVYRVIEELQFTDDQGRTIRIVPRGVPWVAAGMAQKPA